MQFMNVFAFALALVTCIQISSMTMTEAEWYKSLEEGRTATQKKATDQEAERKASEKRQQEYFQKASEDLAKTGKW